MGLADAFLEAEKLEFFYDQAPEGMKSLGTSYSMTTLGMRSFVSSALLSAVSKRNGCAGWISDNLNKSHLDYYYAFLDGLSCVNFGVFLIVSRLYVYKPEISEFSDESSRDKELAIVWKI